MVSANGEVLAIGGPCDGLEVQECEDSNLLLLFILWGFFLLFFKQTA